MWLLDVYHLSQSYINFTMGYAFNRTVNMFLFSKPIKYQNNSTHRNNIFLQNLIRFVSCIGNTES